MDTISEILQRDAAPMEPLPTETQSFLRPLPGIRAVLFDVYGTLLISGSGDVGTVAAAPGPAFAAACAALDLGLRVDGDEAVTLFRQQIESQHATARAAGIRYPEVDILEVWRQTLAAMHERGWTAVTGSTIDVASLSVEYERRANPVWPMPGLEECLAGLQRAGLEMGIVSNAQFFTPQLFPAFLQKTVTELGFSSSLAVWSFQHGRAKPDTHLYQLALEALQRRGIQAHETLFVGNDMLNDVMPAQRVGFATALFAGDARSLRWRHGDERVEGVHPDVILTALPELGDCLPLSDG